MKRNNLTKQIPNLFSILRIFLSAVVLFSFSIHFRLLSIVVIVAGALSDFFDGYFARKFHLESSFGQIIDPIADKFFANAILWGIYIYEGHDKIMLAIALLLSIRDIVLLCGGAFVLIKNIDFSMQPTYISKINTCAIFILAVISACFGCNLYCKIICGFCIVTTVSTSIVYITNFVKNSSTKKIL